MSWLDARVTHTERAAGLGEDPGFVSRAVVGEDPVDHDPARVEMRVRPPQERAAVSAPERRPELEVRDAARGIDRDMHLLPADGVTPAHRRAEAIVPAPTPALQAARALHIDLHDLSGRARDEPPAAR